MKKAAQIISIILLILFQVGLLGGGYYLYTQNKEIKAQITSLKKPSNLESTTRDDMGVASVISGCDSDCQLQIKDEVAQAIAALPTATETFIEKQTVVETKPSGTTYIPMDGTHTTTSTDWEDVDDSAVYIDLINDYGNSATVSWQTSLKVAHANGQAYARLWDDTNKIAVDFSELTTTNNADYLGVSSGNLPFWRGRNLYKVQVKSLNGFEVTYSGGKIKVSY